MSQCIIYWRRIAS